MGHLAVPTRDAQLHVQHQLVVPTPLAVQHRVAVAEKVVCSADYTIEVAANHLAELILVAAVVVPADVNHLAVQTLVAVAAKVAEKVAYSVVFAKRKAAASQLAELIRVVHRVVHRVVLHHRAAQIPDVHLVVQHHHVALTPVALLANRHAAHEGNHSVRCLAR